MVVGEGHPGHELPFLLIGAFRRLIDDLHGALAQEGHPDLRPAHAVAMRSIGPAGGRVTEMSSVVGVSKQAMGKTVERLEAMGYVTREVDAHDRRARVVNLTERGVDALTRSGRILESWYDESAARLGEDNLRDAAAVLREIRGDAAAFEHLVRWYGQP